MEGYGKLIFEKGKYEGEFKDDCFNGFGTLLN